jgi:hypothetical protein
MQYIKNGENGPLTAMTMWLFFFLVCFVPFLPSCSYFKDLSGDQWFRNTAALYAGQSQLFKKTLCVSASTTNG